MYTKEMAEQNRQMIAMAKELLDNKNADINTVANQHHDIYEAIAKEFLNVTEVRIYAKIATAIRHRKGQSNRGGLQDPSGGRPPLPEGQKRQKHSFTLAPGIKELAQMIAKKKGLDGGGHLIDQLVLKEAARLGITIK